MPDRCDYDRKSRGGLWAEANFMTKGWETLRRPIEWVQVDQV